MIRSSGGPAWCDRSSPTASPCPSPAPTNTQLSISEQGAGQSCDLPLLLGRFIVVWETHFQDLFELSKLLITQAGEVKLFEHIVNRPSRLKPRYVGRVGRISLRSSGDKVEYQPLSCAAPFGRRIKRTANSCSQRRHANGLVALPNAHQPIRLFPQQLLAALAVSVAAASAGI